MGIWQLISDIATRHKYFLSHTIAFDSNRRIENSNQNKHSRENAIESSDISFHIHACLHSHTMKIENGNYLHVVRARGVGEGNELSSIVFHPQTTPATNRGNSKNEKKTLK